MTDSEKLDMLLKGLLDISGKIGRIEATLNAAPRAVSAPNYAAGGITFPPFGKSNGKPIAGADPATLEYYAGFCRKTLNDPAKSHFHDKERGLLAAIEAELGKHSTSAPYAGSMGGPDDFGGPPDDGLPF